SAHIAHSARCAMCADELRDLERFSATLPVRPKPAPEPAPGPIDPALTEFPAASPRAAYRDEYATRRVLPPRVSPRGEVIDEPPSRYGEPPPAALPWRFPTALKT
ncbi:MAG: hypothetical protein ABL900_01065, partial [Burkholderiaceae bacterium]